MKEDHYRISPEATPRKKHDLWICTLTPNAEKPTPEMMFNLAKLHVANEDNLQVHRCWVSGGKFPHRLTRKEKDTRQCELRQKYLDTVPNGDWILILDSDEAIGGALKHIPLLLDLAEDNNIDVIMISELLPDFNILLRPRLIKNREGLRYGGPDMKHDWINYHPRDDHECDAGEMYVELHNNYKEGELMDMFKRHKELNCSHARNYIDVGRDDLMIADFIYFNHYKNGQAVKIFSSDKIGAPEHVSLPVQLVKLEEEP